MSGTPPEKKSELHQRKGKKGNNNENVEVNRGAFIAPIHANPGDEVESIWKGAKVS